MHVHACLFVFLDVSSFIDDVLDLPCHFGITSTYNFFNVFLLVVCFEFGLIVVFIYVFVILSAWFLVPQRFMVHNAF